MLYSQYDGARLALNPLANFLQRGLIAIDTWDQLFPNFAFLNNYYQARFALTHNLIKDYPKLPWSIKDVDVNGSKKAVKESVVMKKDFCELRLFSIDSKEKRPALFMVAPLSGHYATLLRDTLQTFVNDFDVYITDWINPRDVPQSVGEFGFDDYIMYVIEFSKYIREQVGYVKALAVCQPTVPVVAANAYLAQTEPEYQFEEVILMGGPLDTRESPTQVNDYAMKNSIDWFKQNVIHNVPMWYKGYGRKVYPGFLQHFGFLSMNMKRHTQAHVDFFNHLIQGADLEAKKHQDFYDEYNAVMDLPAKYYIETLENVFMDQTLAKGTMIINGKTLAMSDINKGKYLFLEGELDDISGKGQTHAAYKLMTNIDSNHKNKVIAKQVGHYGIFSGSGFRNNVYPILKTFLLENNLGKNDFTKQDGETLFIDKYQKDLKSSKDVIQKEDAISLENNKKDTVEEKIENKKIESVNPVKKEVGVKSTVVKNLGKVPARKNALVKLNKNNSSNDKNEKK